MTLLILGIRSICTECCGPRDPTEKDEENRSVESTIGSASVDDEFTGCRCHCIISTHMITVFFVYVFLGKGYPRCLNRKFNHNRHNARRIVIANLVSDTAAIFMQGGSRIKPVLNDFS